jgi:hypothetical protein
MTSLLVSSQAAADVTLVEKDGWSVFTNGRVASFFNYTQGDGHPSVTTARQEVDPATGEPVINPDTGQPNIIANVLDGNGNTVTLWGGGVTPSQHGLVDAPAGEDGKVQELRMRTGFVGNVIGFGVKNQITPEVDITGYYAITALITTNGRRKYLTVPVDARESHATVSGPFGSFRFGRMGTLYNRGATELTYRYGFAYGLGWPGSISDEGDNGGNAASAHVGFGVLANGFGGGMMYSTPSLGGLTVNLGVFDANSLVGTPWERVRWPRPETEITFEAPFSETMGMKLFVNGMFQKVYKRDDPEDESLFGAGGGAMFDLNPFHVGFAGHYGKGVGMAYALDPNEVLADNSPGGNRTGDLRTFSGYYLQAMFSLGDIGAAPLDIHAGYGVSQVHLLDTDRTDLVDNDGDDANEDGLSDADGVTPATPTFNDDGNPALVDSVGFVPIKTQTGISAGVTYHATENLHAHLDIFLASFKWAEITPAPTDGTPAVPEQAFVVGNAGLTYDW